MKAKTVTIVETTLTLNEEEKDWLKGLMKKPIPGESSYSNDMRIKLFSSLGSSVPRGIKG